MAKALPRDWLPPARRWGRRGSHFPQSFFRPLLLHKEIEAEPSPPETSVLPRVLRGELQEPTVLRCGGALGQSQAAPTSQGQRKGNRGTRP